MILLLAKMRQSRNNGVKGLTVNCDAGHLAGILRLCSTFWRTIRLTQHCQSDRKHRHETQPRYSSSTNRTNAESTNLTCFDEPVGNTCWKNVRTRCSAISANHQETWGTNTRRMSENPHKNHPCIKCTASREQHGQGRIGYFLPRSFHFLESLERCESCSCTASAHITENVEPTKKDGTWTMMVVCDGFVICWLGCSGREVG